MTGSMRFLVRLRRRTVLATTVVVLSVAFGCLWGAAPALAALNTYYIPTPEAQLLTARTAIEGTAGTPSTTQHAVISIVASANGTIIYYDEWEDGYEANPAAPAQASTKIWGDGNPFNGIPPGYTLDVLHSGSVINLENDVPTPRVPANIFYDGGDKMSATYMLAVTRAGWATPNPGTLLGSAVEVHRTLDWGTDYRSTVGTNIAAGDQNQMFEYTGLFVMASQDGTVVQIDADNNGTFETTTTLAQGQSYLVNGGVRVGGHVVASKIVQVDFVTGDINANFESRWQSPYPTSLWSTDYYSPVGSTVRGANTETTYVFVYNPQAVSIRFTMQTTAGTTNLTAAAGSYVRFTMPVDGGAQFYSRNHATTFSAIATVGARDASNQNHDWGFYLIPQSSLTTMAIVGWGPGRDPTSGVNPLENGSPVWVTPVVNTTVYVDYDADPTTGPLTDPNGNKYNITYAMNAWQSQKVYDGIDLNQTGMRLYTLNDALIAVAWGQDPAIASTGAPGLDLGTTVPPLPEFIVGKTSALSTDVNGNGIMDSGDTIMYTILVTSVGPAPLQSISVIDPWPANITYVANSTTYKLYTGAQVAVPDDGAGTPFPLDGAGVTVPFVTPYQYFTYTFKATVNTPLPPGTTISNTVTAQMNVASLAQTNDVTVGQTPSITRFASSGWVTVNLYAGNAMLYIETRDLDENQNSGLIETIQVTVISAAGGDSEVITLTETGPSTGIFRGTLQSNVASGAGNNNGVLRAPLNDNLLVSYVDNDYPSDTSSATANIQPTLALVTGLSARTAPGGKVVVEWKTLSEMGTLGFELLRHDPVSGDFVRVGDPVPGLVFAPRGGVYRVVDPGAESGHRYTYLLRELEARGATRDYGPFITTVRSGGKGARAPVSGLERQRLPATAAEKARAQAGRRAEQAASAALALRVGTRVKLLSSKPGLVRVAAAQLARPLGTSATRLALLIRNGRLALTYRHASVAYLPSRSGSSFVFYDWGASGPYSDVNVFWLRRGKGLLMGTLASPSSAVARSARNRVATAAAVSASSTATFVDTARAEVDKWSAPTLFFDPRADYWLWDYVVSGVPSMATRDFPIATPGAAGSGQAALVVRMVGVSWAADGANHVSVSLNGTPVGEGRWSGSDPYDLSLLVDGALLVDGVNQVKLTAEADAAGSMVYLDSLEVRYQRFYTAVGDRLLARGNDNSPVSIDGFTSPHVRVFDVSDPKTPGLVAGAPVTVAGQGYQVTFTPATPTTPYLAVGGAAACPRPTVVADIPSKLRSRAAGAQYVIIAPAALKKAAQRLADYRASRGLSARVVDLEDIYDEFNGGMASPLAIRRFLDYASTNWTQAPRFVVLAGAGTDDYKDNGGYGGNLVPALMVGSGDGLVPSDQALADVRGNDGVPEMAIGRLPVVSAAELNAQVARIKAYEAASGAWITKALFVADDADGAGDFPACSDDLATLLAAPYDAQKIYVDAADPAVARAQLLQSWREGPVFINYVGHGALKDLTANGLFNSADVAGLDNGGKLPVVALMTCTAGQFAIPGFDALTETLVLDPDGGAIAAWGPSGLSRNPDAIVLDDGLVRAVFVDGEHTVGTAILDSMKAYAAAGRSRYSLDIYNLMGDPALTVR